MNEFEALLNEYLPEEKKKGEIIEGIILRKEKDFSYLDVNDKLEGKIFTREIEDSNLGDTVEVKILRNDGENIIVSKFLLDREKEFASYETGDIVSGEITEKIKGGYKVKLGKNIAFLPFSLSNLRRDDEYKNKKFKFLIIDKDIKNMTLSRNDLVKKEEEDFYSSLHVGEVVEGKIKEILDFGLIIDLDKTTGFIHISEIDWSLVKDLKTLFTEGDTVKSKIIELDKPLIGICAGFNNILRAIGTDVIEDKTKSHDIYDKEYRHEISIIKGTKLFDLVKKEKYNVNSIHSMIAPKGNVEKYARISAISYDNLVESFELDNKKIYIRSKLKCYI